MNTRSITREQSRSTDRRAIEEYGMSGLVLMENAGRGTADVLCQRLEADLAASGRVASPSVVICCGKGNNAGDGFVVARHLDLRAYAVRVLLWAEPSELTGDAAANFQIIEKAGLPIEVFGNRHDAARLAKSLAPATWVVDALLGTGARGEPRAPLDAVIDQVNAAAVKRLAVDLPSGLDCDTGEPARHTIRADETCTFIALKRGFLARSAEPYVGVVHVLDIGAPRQLIDEILAETSP
jgi:NAD(P)H-hydrate epimerase